MCPFTISAVHSPCLVRASFANKRNSTTEGLGLGAQCLFVRGARASSLCVILKNHTNIRYIFSAAQNSIPISLKTDQHYESPRKRKDVSSISSRLSFPFFLLPRAARAEASGGPAVSTPCHFLALLRLQLFGLLARILEHWHCCQGTRAGPA
jgi:hypothetical protein